MDGSKEVESEIATGRGGALQGRINKILDRVPVPVNRFCDVGDAFTTLQSANMVLELITALDRDGGASEFEMPVSGPATIAYLRDMIQDSIKYASELVDMEKTLRTHADIGGLEKFIALHGLEEAISGEVDVTPRH
jgi:hypothetical protein